MFPQDGKNECYVAILFEPKNIPEFYTIMMIFVKMNKLNYLINKKILFYSRYFRKKTLQESHHY